MQKHYLKQKTNAYSTTQQLTLSGFFVALGIILPFAVSHGMGLPGTLLLPMHIPVLLCGFICGPLFGTLCGLILPILSSVLTAMPSLFPMVPIMTAELAVYGLVSGILFYKTSLGTHKRGIYVSLIAAMLAGRVAYGTVFYLLVLGFGELKALSVWAAVLQGLAGIILQLLLIPPIVLHFGGNYMNKNKSAVAAAKKLIKEGKATCVVIKDGKLLSTSSDSGIAPVLAMYDAGLLSGAILVDKIVGRATAMIAVHGGVVECFGATVSKGAYDFLIANNIPTEYAQLPEHIVNRQGTDICPMEKAVMGIDDTALAIEAVRKTLKELADKK